MRAVVTGGAGFIGSHLLELLAARGDEAICLDRPGANLRWVRDLPVTIIPADLGTPGTLRGALEGADVVFHLAALTEARTAEEFHRVNVEGTEHLLREAAAAGAARVVLVSSLAATGPCRNGELLSPGSVPHPLSHYGWSKLCAESVAHAWADRIPVTILRFPAVYGPRERGVLKFFRMVRQGFALSIGSWDRELSMLFVRDAVAGLYAAGVSPEAAGRTYCIAHPETLTWSRIAEAVGRAVGRPPHRLALPCGVARGVALAIEGGARLVGRAAILNRDRVRELTQRRWVCDTSRARLELHWAAAWPFEQGATETAAWYRAAGWL